MRAEETADSLPRAERDGRTVAVVPKGPTYEIPAGWVDTNFRDQEKTIAAILDSVRWPDPPTGK